MSSTASDVTVIPARPRPAAPSSTATPAPASAPKTPLSVDPTAHLDPHAYIQGHHVITLGPGVLIHPRARLVSAHGPLTIGAGSTILERCVIGGPAPDLRDVVKGTVGDGDGQGLETKIGVDVMVQAGAEVMAGAEVGDACVLEAKAVVERGTKIGSESRVCAECTVGRDVSDRMVVWGDGQRIRRRVVDDGFENGRLRALRTEREATINLLKVAAAKASLGKRRG